MEKTDGFVGKGRFVYPTEMEAQLSFLDGVGSSGYEMLLRRLRTTDGDEPKWVPPLREAVLWLADRIRENELELERMLKAKAGVED